MYDQYSSFIALEGRLFSLGLQDTYLQLNDPKARDTQIQVQHTQLLKICKQAIESTSHNMGDSAKWGHMKRTKEPFATVYQDGLGL